MGKMTSPTPTKLTKAKLIKELLRLGVESHKPGADVEVISSDADNLLVEFIGSKAVEEAWKSVRHY